MICIEIIEKGIVKFDDKSIFKENEFAHVITYMLISCKLFFVVYDECLKLFKKHEKMPILKK